MASRTRTTPTPVTSAVAQWESPPLDGIKRNHIPEHRHALAALWHARPDDAARTEEYVCIDLSNQLRQIDSFPSGPSDGIVNGSAHDNPADVFPMRREQKQFGSKDEDLDVDLIWKKLKQIPNIRLSATQARG